MTSFERFDVLTALFPFIDLAQRKPHSSLVLSSAAFNASHGHPVAVMIATGSNSHWPSDYVIVDLEAAGLRHRSVVRRKVFTIPFAAVGRRIGRFSPADRIAFGRAFETTLAEPVPGETSITS